MRRWGATVIDADAIVRELQAPGGPVVAAMAAALGDGILLPDGSLDRAAVRHRILADPAARSAIEGIIHPAVARRREALVDAAAARGVAVIVSDIPLLFEAADPEAFDAVILVDAPAPLRLARLRDRGLGAEEAERLMAAQQPADAKRARSDFVIENAGTPAELQARTRAVWESLQARARPGSP